MKSILIFLLLLLSGNHLIKAQSNLIIDKYENISFISLDTLGKNQCTVIEYDEFIVIIELPIAEWEITENGKSKVERFASFLNENFKNKPVKYILCSHWHLHSLSSINYFIEKGAQVIVTTNNWKESIKRNLISSENIKNGIVEINRDTTILKQTNFPIEISYLDSTYERKPTTDYLLFYFPRNKTLHASCMCWVEDIDYSKVTMYCYSGRLMDLERVINEKSLKVEKIIRLECVPTESGNIPAMFTYNYFQSIMNKGLNSSEMISHYVNLDLKMLQLKQDSIIHQAIEQHLHPNLLNIAAYECLSKNEFEKAIELSKLLNLYYPGNIKYINTLGESYYKHGKITEACYYDKVLKRMDKQTSYGYKSWEVKKSN